jgi:hypothetical protein
MLFKTDEGTNSYGVFQSQKGESTRWCGIALPCSWILLQSMTVQANRRIEWAHHSETRMICDVLPRMTECTRNPGQRIRGWHGTRAQYITL